MKITICFGIVCAFLLPSKLAALCRLVLESRLGASASSRLSGEASCSRGGASGTAFQDDHLPSRSGCCPSDVDCCSDMMAVFCGSVVGAGQDGACRTSRKLTAQLTTTRALAAVLLVVGGLLVTECTGSRTGRGLTGHVGSSVLIQLRAPRLSACHPGIMVVT